MSFPVSRHVIGLNGGKSCVWGEVGQVWPVPVPHHLFRQMSRRAEPGSNLQSHLLSYTTDSLCQTVTWLVAWWWCRLVKMMMMMRVRVTFQKSQSTKVHKSKSTLARIEPVITRARYERVGCWGAEVDDDDDVFNGLNWLFRVSDMYFTYFVV